MIDLTGARLQGGPICIRTRYIRGKTRFYFYDTKTKKITSYTLDKIFYRLSSDEATSGAVLGALRQVLQDKGVCPFDRATLAGQCLGRVFFLYEAGYRGTLWPRYYWRLPYSLSFHESAAYCLFMESLTQEVVAEKDTREPVTLSLAKILDPPRCHGSIKQYVQDLLSARGSTA